MKKLKTVYDLKSKNELAKRLENANIEYKCEKKGPSILNRTAEHSFWFDFYVSKTDYARAAEIVK